MGKTRGMYNAEYPVGTQVNILQRDKLLIFQAEWKWHNPLTTEQLKYAGMTAQVKTFNYYHGGDELYTLMDIPGIWHEECLEPTNAQ